MLFFALWFIFTDVYGLIKGKLFYNVWFESANAELKKARGEIKEIPKETNSKVAFVVFYMIIYIIIEYIFIYKSLKVDPHLYPTLAIIVFIFLGFIINSIKKGKDLTTEEGRAKYLIRATRRYTITGFMSKIIFITYFGYMFGVLMGLIK